jgi:predicted aspartyl protease
MKRHAIFGSLTLACAVQLATPALAQDCAPLKQIADTQMLDNGDGRYLVPVTMNGAPKLMLFNTGASNVTDDVAREFDRPLQSTAGSAYNIVGQETHKYTVVDKFQLGNVMTEHQPMMVIPGSDNHLDGALGSDVMSRYDMDVDFGAGQLKYFLPDHCLGKIIYWSPPTVASIPIIAGQSVITAWVKLNGKDVRAAFSPGSSVSMMNLDNARRLFDLTPESRDMKSIGNVNGSPKLASFSHTFETLTFGGVSVKSPRVIVIPDHIDVAGRAQTPDLLIGMNILQHLHIYMSAKENTLYISEGSSLRKPGEQMVRLDELVAGSPSNAGFRNLRCYERAIRKVNLEGALEDCELALKARPRSINITDSKAFVLYQLGRYKEALDTYNQVLSLDAKFAPSLYVRGFTKKKLGNTPAGDADIAAAKTLKSDIEKSFINARLSE